MDFKTFTHVQKNSSQELYGFLPESATTSQSFTANPLTTLTPISERTSIDENSCNAVDIPLAGQVNEQTLTIQNELSQFLCFNGRFPQTKEIVGEKPPLEEENAVDFLLNISAEAPENTFVEQMTEDEGDGGGKIILSAAKKVTFEESMRSPDLFADDDSEDEKEIPIIPTITEEPELNESAEVEVENCNFIKKREKLVYRRYRSYMSGVIPPPSVINSNANLLEAIHSNRTNILNSFEKLRSGNPTPPFDGEPLFKPSHAKEVIDQMEWPDIQHVNYHGIHYNVSEISEKIEGMTLQITDRFVGCETASSYQPLPSSAKKRNERLKKLTQSPGSRLSHLAKRRSVFSSVNLQSKADTSLNSSRQILLDNKKSKRKGTTPKRNTPSKNKLIRKTPSSSARKRLFFRTETQIQSKPGPSRETSKRQLFQSPAKSLSKKTVVQQPPKSEFVNRLEKSKRALFSPDKSQDSNNSISSFTFSQPQIKHSLLRSDSRSSISSSIDSLTKRKRDDDDVQKSSKFFRTTSSSNLDSERITPRSLKIKSQSFCVNGDLDKRSNLLRTGSVSTIGSSHLSENHRKKLLWAVSHALNSKQISVSNAKFKPFATTLARSLKSIFLEYYHKNGTSTSETMLKLAKKYVYLAISGNSSDEIYLLAKNDIEHKKKTTRVSGYINKEDYENATQKNTESIKMISENSVDSFNFSQFSQQSHNEPQDTNLSAIKLLNVQQTASLQNSSSKIAALRENIDSNSAGKMSAQKNFTGRDQSNISPYNSVEKNTSGRKTTTLVGGNFSGNSCGINTSSTFKVKRQISFDN
ncbi:hypothetical protein ACFFRR_007656 [Megaselia abdita]